MKPGESSVECPVCGEEYEYFLTAHMVRYYKVVGAWYGSGLPDHIAFLLDERVCQNCKNEQDEEDEDATV